MRKIHSLGIFLSLWVGVANASTELSDAITNVRTACGGIGAELTDMKKMAGINTVITGVGTASGAVALGTGLAKLDIDEQIDAEFKKWAEKNKNVPVENLIIEEETFTVAIEEALSGNQGTDLQKLNDKSKLLGNIRTGTLAASTVTNIAGTAIAATNQIKGDFADQIQKCISATQELSNAKMLAQVEGVATESELATAEKMISACGEYEYIDISPINKRATGAAIVSGVGMGSGVAGVITSAIANTDKTRQAYDEQGVNKKAKDLNMTANIMSGVSTAASATATVFNATQIAAIKKLVAVSETCEGALK